MTPIDPGFHGSSNTWQIEILNRSFSKIHSFAAIVIPRRPGINIVFATIQGSNDGGFYMKEAKLSDGAFSFDIERIGPRRRKHFLVRATGTTELLAQGTNIATRNRRSYKAGTASPSDILITSHLRLMILMLYFVLGTLVVIGRLLYLGT
ncbi:hypothetical protein [Sphingomonas adhaesiva]|uniref:hypothetical protein n=1 Tax=Sphingomonas adhaesiva TaxID=28212 RepID=UPI002FFA4DFF